jgi:hypothetical protein
MAAHFFLFLFVGVACALGLVIFSTMKSLIDGIGRGLSSLMHIFLDMARATAIIATASGVGALVGVAVGCGPACKKDPVSGVIGVQ